MREPSVKFWKDFVIRNLGYDPAPGWVQTAGEVFGKSALEGLTLGYYQPDIDRVSAKRHPVARLAGGFTGGMVPVVATVLGGGAAGAAIAGRVGAVGGRVVGGSVLGGLRRAETPSQRLTHAVGEGLTFGVFEAAPVAGRAVRASIGKVLPRSQAKAALRSLPPGTGRGVRKSATLTPAPIRELTAEMAAIGGPTYLIQRTEGASPEEAATGSLIMAGAHGLLRRKRGLRKTTRAETEETLNLSPAFRQLPPATTEAVKIRGLLPGRVEGEPIVAEGKIQPKQTTLGLRATYPVSEAAPEPPVIAQTPAPPDRSRAETVHIASNKKVAREALKTAKKAKSAEEVIRAEKAGEKTEAKGELARAEEQETESLRIRRAEKDRLEAEQRAQKGETGAVEDKQLGKVWTIERSEYDVEPEVFQNRKKAYAEKTVERIVRDYHPDKMDPVHVWKEPESGRWKLISGHSREEALKRLGQPRAKVQEFRGTREEAIKFAREEANRQATPETIPEDISAYRVARDRGEPKNYLEENFARGGRSLETVENWSHLKEGGSFLRALGEAESVRENQFGHVKRISGWVGESRRRWKEKLTDEHENELFDYFYREGARSEKRWLMKKEDFFSRMERRVGDAFFDPGEKLNIDRVKITTAGRARSDTAEAYAQTDRMREEIRQHKKDVTLTRETKHQVITEKRQRIVEIERGVEQTRAQTSLMDVLIQRAGVSAEKRMPLEAYIGKYKVSGKSLQEAISKIKIVGPDGKLTNPMRAMPRTLRAEGLRLGVGWKKLPGLLAEYLRDGLKRATAAVRSWIKRVWQWMDERIDWQAMAKNYGLGTAGGGVGGPKLKSPKITVKSPLHRKLHDLTFKKVLWDDPKRLAYLKEKYDVGAFRELTARQAKEMIGDLEAKYQKMRSERQQRKAKPKPTRTNPYERKLREKWESEESKQQSFSETSQTQLHLDELNLEKGLEKRKFRKEELEIVARGYFNKDLKNISKIEAEKMDKVLREMQAAEYPKQKPTPLEDLAMGGKLFRPFYVDLQKTKVGRELILPTLGRFLNIRRNIRGPLNARFSDFLKKYGIGSIRAFLISPKKMWNTVKWMRENGKAYIENRGKVKVPEGIERNTLEAMREAADYIFEELARLAESWKVKGFKRIGEDRAYFPHHLTHEARTALEFGRGDLYEAIRKKAEVKGGWGLKSKDYWTELTGLVRNKRFGSLENPRVADLPEFVEVGGKRVKVLETDPLKVIPKHIGSAARRLAWIKVMGQGGERADSFIKLAKGEVYDRPELNINSHAYGEKLAEVMNLLQGLRPAKEGPWVGKFPTIARSTIAIIRAGHLSLAAIPNAVAGWVPIAERYGVRNVLRNWIAALRGESKFEKLRQLDAWQHDVMTQLWDLRDMEGPLAAGSKKWLSLVGFNAANRMLNKIAAGSALDYFKAVAERGDAKALRMLTEEFFYSSDDVARILKTRRLNAEDVTRIAQEAPGITNIYAESPLRRQPWMEKRFRRFALAYCSYIRVLGNSLSRCISEAKRGNVKPLAVHLFGTFGAAETTLWLKGWLRNREREDTNIWGRLYYDLLYAGTFGPIGEVAQRMGFAAKYGENPAAELGGPFLETLGDIWVNIAGPVIRGEKPKIAKAVGQEWPMVPVIKGMAEKVSQ